MSELLVAASKSSEPFAAAAAVFLRLLLLLQTVLCMDIQVFNGRATWKQLAQNWSVSYIGNMMGTFLIVTLMTQGAVFPEMAVGPVSTAMPKVGLTFSQVRIDYFLAHVCRYLNRFM